jgi:Mrp family chromosome partitioning ATPase
VKAFTEFAELSRHEAKAPEKALPWKRLRAPIAIDQATQRRLRLRGGLGRDAASEAYRLVRTQLLQRMARHGYRTLAIISAGQDDGKTLSAVNLAFSIAQETRYTALLVDLDLRAPSVHKTLGLEVTRGLECYLRGSAPLESLLLTVLNERMAVLPCLRPVASPSEVLASTQMQNLVAELGSRYRDRTVLFDLSPMLVGDDVISFLPYVDAALVVVGEGVTHKSDLKRVFELLGETPVVGTILNRSREATLKPYR